MPKNGKVQKKWKISFYNVNEYNSREALVESGAPFNVDPVAGSSRSLNRNNGSPSSIDDPTFWVPPTLHKQSSLVGDLQSSAGMIG